MHVGRILPLSIILLCGNAHAGIYAISSPIISRTTSGPENYTPVENAEVIESNINKYIMSIRKGNDEEFWFNYRIMGNDETMNKLRDSNQIISYLDVYCSRFRPRVSHISVGIDQRDWDKYGKKIEKEFKNRGFFDWRTRAHIKYRSNCNTMEIDVVDGRGKSVPYMSSKKVRRMYLKVN